MHVIVGVTIVALAALAGVATIAMRSTAEEPERAGPSNPSRSRPEASSTTQRFETAPTSTATSSPPSTAPSTTETAEADITGLYYLVGPDGTEVSLQTLCNNGRAEGRIDLQGVLIIPGQPGVDEALRSLCESARGSWTSSGGTVTLMDPPSADGPNGSTIVLDRRGKDLAVVSVDGRQPGGTLILRPVDPSTWPAPSIT